ncbi:MAG TPA: SMP-30/gluconolactonase/LRE family protein [Solirubrobacterales bacterium]|nr:SMP-30/gluconolactonase/LRE family protein [Solirubrobacterales bacterium]
MGEPVAAQLTIESFPASGAVDTGPWPAGPAKGIGALEGPVWTDTGAVVFVAMDHGFLYQWNPDGEVTLFAVPGGGPNGLAIGAHGDVYVAQNGGHGGASRRWPGITGGVQIVSPDGRVSWLTQDPVAPNDLCFGPDGMLYVTDPTRSPARDDSRIWRCDPATGESEIVATPRWYANGIGFYDDALYVANTFERTIMRYAWRPGERLGAPEEFARLDRGLPDGFAFDQEGMLVIAAIGEGGAPGDLPVVAPSGQVIERLSVGSGREYTNVAVAADGRLAVTDASEGRLLIAAGRPAGGAPLHRPNPG